MTIASNKNTPRNTYTATAGQTAFTIGFEFFKIADVKVYKNGTLLTYNASPSTSSQYKITGTASASDDAYEFGAGGTVTLGAGATLNDSIVIIRDIVLERTSDFPTTGAFDITSLNTQLDTITSMLSDLKQQSDRSVKLLDTDTVSSTITLPAKATRQDKILSFDSNGNAETTVNSAGLATLSTITSDITTVSGIAADVSQVASDSADVQTVATNISSINTVSTNIADVITVANDLNEAISEVETVADDLNEAVSEIDTVSNNITDVQTVGNATNIANIGTVAGEISPTNNISTLANVSSDITTLATNLNGSNTIGTVATDLSGSNNIGVVATNIANVNTVGIDLSGSNNIGTVATNIVDVNTFANQYRIGSTDPTTSLDQGDLFYNSTDQALKYYNGSSWASITAGLTDIIGDVTPQLGGNLDVNGNSIVSVSNGNIAITPDGTGKVILDGLSFPTADGINGQALTTDGSGNVSFTTIQASEITTEGSIFSNYNEITGNVTTTTASTKNSFLFGPITISGSATWTVNGSGTLEIL